MQHLIMKTPKNCAIRCCRCCHPLRTWELKILTGRLNLSLLNFLRMLYCVQLMGPIVLILTLCASFRCSSVCVCVAECVSWSVSRGCRSLSLSSVTVSCWEGTRSVGWESVCLSVSVYIWVYMSPYFMNNNSDYLLSHMIKRGENPNCYFFNMDEIYVPC